MCSLCLLLASALLTLLLARSGWQAAAALCDGPPPRSAANDGGAAPARSRPPPIRAAGRLLRGVASRVVAVVPAPVASAPEEPWRKSHESRWACVLEEWRKRPLVEYGGGGDDAGVGFVGER